MELSPEGIPLNPHIRHVRGHTHACVHLREQNRQRGHQTPGGLLRGEAWTGILPPSQPGRGLFGEPHSPECQELSAKPALGHEDHEGTVT